MGYNLNIYKNYEKLAQCLVSKTHNKKKIQHCFSGQIKKLAIRQAVRLIYYGVFLELREKLRNKGFSIRQNQPHSFILFILNQIADDDVVSSYKELKELREKADYELDIPIDFPEFRRAKFLAKFILNNV